MAVHNFFILNYTGMMTCCSCECNGDRYMVKREVQLENASKTVTALKKLVNNTGWFEVYYYHSSIKSYSIKFMKLIKPSINGSSRMST